MIARLSNSGNSKIKCRFVHDGQIHQKKRSREKKSNVGVGGGSFSGIRQDEPRKEVTRIERDIALHSGRENSEMGKEQFEITNWLKVRKARRAYDRGERRRRSIR